jgi:drug/metabolite transporter (DMT)-like permease
VVLHTPVRFSTLALAIAFVFFWNSGFVGAENELPYAGPFTQLFWRYLALCLLMAGYLLVRGRLRWPGWRKVSVASVVGIFAHAAWLSFTLLSLATGVPAGIVALVVALQPLATGALSGLVVGEPVGRMRWLGLLTGFAGVAVTVAARMETTEGVPFYGYFLPFGAALSMTMASLIQRRTEVCWPERILPMGQQLFWQSLASCIVLLGPAILFEKMATEWTQEFVVTMAWLVIAVSLLAYALMWKLLARVDAARVASLFYFGPPVTMLMAWVMFGDEIRFMDLVGLSIIAVGVGLAHWRNRG